ncbi:ubiquitin carboxyl-terminal hydrolase [Rhizoctonia solani]|uniref:ubiquitinyl hydrolase 1 n=1 Tax=Rhizoctonia solani TaxID=456999 RepID=A0A8H8NQP5_9AGAM|nr:ubiquitin carboxyl-terminal hydrolase [Rhizoctonia solani]QRW16968.1 ubiquitin carboxyl-terminal hydrolase [Rhizoctonia solani]
MAKAVPVHVKDIREQAKSASLRAVAGFAPLNILNSAHSIADAGLALEHDGDLRGALYKYSQAAILLEYVMGSAEYKHESPKSQRGVLYHQTTKLSEFVIGDILPRAKKIEDRLREIERTQPPSPAAAEPDSRPIGSLRERMRMLEQAGMDVGNQPQRPQKPPKPTIEPASKPLVSPDPSPRPNDMTKPSSPLLPLESASPPASRGTSSIQHELEFLNNITANGGPPSLNGAAPAQIPTLPSQRITPDRIVHDDNDDPASPPTPNLPIPYFPHPQSRSMSLNIPSPTTNNHGSPNPSPSDTRPPRLFRQGLPRPIRAEPLPPSPRFRAPLRAIENGRARSTGTEIGQARLRATDRAPPSTPGRTVPDRADGIYPSLRSRQAAQPQRAVHPCLGLSEIDEQQRPPKQRSATTEEFEAAFPSIDDIEANFPSLDALENDAEMRLLKLGVPGAPPGRTASPSGGMGGMGPAPSLGFEFGQQQNQQILSRDRSPMRYPTSRAHLVQRPRPPTVRAGDHLWERQAPVSTRSIYVGVRIRIHPDRTQIRQAAQAGFAHHKHDHGQDEYESRRLPVDNVVCIEPIVLGRKGMSAKELQEALVLSSKTERTLFERRNTFDLVVLADASSTEFADPSTPLNLLFRIIYETEFLKPLRRPPVFLHGGIKAWGDQVGEFKGEDVVVATNADAGKRLARKPAVSGRPASGSVSHTRMPQDVGLAGSSFGTSVRTPITYPERAVSPPTSSGTPAHSQRPLEDMMSPPPPANAGYFEHPHHHHAYSGSVALSTTRPVSIDYPNLIRPPRSRPPPRWSAPTPGRASRSRPSRRRSSRTTRVIDDRGPGRNRYARTLDSLPGRSNTTPKNFAFPIGRIHEDLNRIIVKPQFEELTPEREAELEGMPKQLAGAHEWARYKRRNDSIVVDYFQGQFCNQMQCLTCGQTSTTYNAFLNLSVPIPANKGVTKVSLDECIKALVGREVMDNADAWHCPRCKTARRAAKQLTFSRMPPVLIIHLKRFSFKGPFTDKLETLVDFPLKDLDLTNYMPPPLTPNMDKDGLERFSPQDPRAQIPPYKYELYGVANHFGSLSSGHYTAFVKSRGKWMYCDDSRITPAEPKEVVGKPAYILFYKRVPPGS